LRTASTCAQSSSRHTRASARLSGWASQTRAWIAPARSPLAPAASRSTASPGPNATSVEKPSASSRQAALRYEGQNFELEVEIPEHELDEGGWEALLDTFQEEHERHYGFSLPGEPIELINLRVTAFVADAAAQPSAPAPVEREQRSRPVWFGEAPVEDCPVILRSSLAAGELLDGPAVIQEPDSTTLVWPGDVVRVLDSGILELTIGAAE
jgi:N-methylhydantoinase A/oxoprolinase/acetone carboxylase beta subunit